MPLAEPLSKKTGKMEASDDDGDKNLPDPLTEKSDDDGDPSTEKSQNSEESDVEENENLCELSTERNQKRKLSDLQDDQNLSLDSESETPSSSKIRKTHLPSTSSDYTTGNESEGESDLSCSGEEGVNDFVGNWEYKDLLDLNIRYAEKPEPLENFVQEVKDAFMNRKGFCLECSDLSRSLKRQLEESLTFSYDLRKIRDLAYTSVDYREDELKKVHQEMKEIVKKMWRNSENMQSDEQGLDSYVKSYTQCQMNGMVFALREFAVETSQLIKKTLFTKAESEGRGKRHRGHTGSLGHHCDTECVQNPDNFFQNYFEVFGRMFFLKKGEIPWRFFTCKNRAVRNNPDLVYHFFSERKTEEELFFLLEVKESPVNQGAVDIEEQLGTRVMAQVGAELLSQSMCSVFYPCSLGILCRETKLIFVFLKITLEHSIAIRKGERGLSDNPGKVMYTETFDILKAEDRLKMADFLFWLGFVQDYGKYKFF